MEKKILLPVNIIRRLFAKSFLWKNNTYTKYVIISHGRSGSTFFRSLLNSHPDIKCYGELFNPVPKKTFFFPDHFPLNIKETPSYLENMRREQSVQFLEKYIWRLQNKNIKAVGFKLFYYHAKDMDWNRIWAYLQEDSSIKIIHLHRNNCLKTVLSHQTAIKHKRWHSNVEKQEPLYLDFNYCKKYFEDFHQYEKSISTKFINHNIYKFYYEDLISEKENIMSEIFKFLDVQEMDSSSSMKKLNKKPLDQSIKNYYELKQKFMDTPWQKYFTI